MSPLPWSPSRRRDGIDPRYGHSLIVESMLRTLERQRPGAYPVRFWHEVISVDRGAGYSPHRTNRAVLGDTALSSPR